MRFRLIDVAKKDFPVQRLCKVLDISPSGYFALEGPPGLSPSAYRPDAARACSRGLCRVERDLWQPAHGARATRRRLGDRTPARCPPDAREQHEGPTEAALQAHHRQLACLPDRAEPLGSGLHGERPEPEVGCRHLLMSGRERVGCIWPSSSISWLGGWSAGQPATAFIRNWRFQPCAGRSSYGVRPQGLFTTRTAAANIAPSSIRRNCETAAF